jgi:hypothetical protein
LCIVIIAEEKTLHSFIPIWNWWQYLYMRYLCFPSQLHYYFLSFLFADFSFCFSKKNAIFFNVTLCVFSVFTSPRRLMEKNNFLGKCRSIWRNCKLRSGSCKQFWSVLVAAQSWNCSVFFIIISYWRNWCAIFLSSWLTRKILEKLSSSFSLRLIENRH